MNAEQALKQIKEALDKGEQQIESGELLEMDILESISGIVDSYFRKDK